MSISKVNVSGTDHQIVGSPRYATCSTAAATAAKVATIADGSSTFSLEKGARICVSFTYANTASAATLNVASTGAKAICWQGSALVSSQYWQAGAVVDFVYDGNGWSIVGVAKDNNSTVDISDKVSKSGDTMTGKLTVPQVETGDGNSNYFQCRKFRGEGNADTYYHAIDFGYQNHDRVDFHEYGGIWSFYKNQTGKVNDGVLCGKITSNGWEGRAKLESGSTMVTSQLTENSNAIATTAFVHGLIDNVKHYSASNPPPYPVTSVNNKTGAVTLAKGDVGLGNVDNTSDANKPISKATQAALNNKQSKITANGILKGDGNGNITAADETEVELVDLPQEVFWATYGKTTPAELNAAWNAGKLIKLKQGPTSYELGIKDGNKAYFYGVLINSGDASVRRSKLDLVNGTWEQDTIGSVCDIVQTISLPTASWTGSDPYTQKVTIFNSDAKTKVDIQPSEEVYDQLVADNVGYLAIKNVNGTLTAVAKGGKPSADLTVQVTYNNVY